MGEEHRDAVDHAVEEVGRVIPLLAEVEDQVAVGVPAADNQGQWDDTGNRRHSE